MTEFLGRVDVKNTSGSEARIKLEGDERNITLFSTDGKFSIILDGSSGNMTLYDGGRNRGFALLAKMSGADDAAGLWIGANVTDGTGRPKAGYLNIRDKTGIDSMVLDGRNNSVVLRNKAGSNSIVFDATSGTIVSSRIELKDKAGGKDSMILDGTNNSVALRNKAGSNSIVFDAGAGDIILQNADCAEDFDVSHSTEIEPGTVMVIEQEGKLKECDLPYDKRVAGVISGGGNYKPGLVLDKRKSIEIRKSISLMGKVYCKVDAQCASIDVGDLLTTSSTKGHAMKAADPMKAFGSVIGKALCPLKMGTGLIPILIALQ
jgi:hypothetical protein